MFYLAIDKQNGEAKEVDEHYIDTPRWGTPPESFETYETEAEMKEALKGWHKYFKTL